MVDMAVLHVVITKQFTFRGKPERFSNGYMLETTSSLDQTFVKSVADALVAMEQSITWSGITFPYRVGGPLGQNAVYAEEVASPPTGSWSQSPFYLHQENCVLAQSRIAPKRYMSKYYHGVVGLRSGMDDTVGSSDKTRIETALVKLTNGTLPGSATYCQPNGALATNPFIVNPYVRTHQLKRRGKRP